MVAKLPVGRALPKPYWVKDGALGNNWVTLYSGEPVSIINRLPMHSVHAVMVDKTIGDGDVLTISDICHATWSVLRDNGLLCLCLWNSIDIDKRYLMTPSWRVVGELQRRGWHICRSSKAGEGIYLLAKSQRAYIKELDGKESNNAAVINAVTSKYGCCPKCSTPADDMMQVACPCNRDTEEFLVPCTILDPFANPAMGSVVVNRARRYIGVSGVEFDRRQLALMEQVVRERDEIDVPMSKGGNFPKST